MHKQGQFFGVCLANNLFESLKPVFATEEGAEEVMVLDAQICQLCTRAVYRYVMMLFILHTVPVALYANCKLVRDSIVLLPEQLNIHIVNGESEIGESA